MVWRDLGNLKKVGDWKYQMTHNVEGVQAAAWVWVFYAPQNASDVVYEKMEESLAKEDEKQGAWLQNAHGSIH